MTVKNELIFWILAPIIVYLGLATLIVLPYMVWMITYIPYFGVGVVILAVVWLFGFFWLYRRYDKEKADSRQEM